MLSLSCIPCITSQILRTLNIINISEKEKSIIFKKTLSILSNENWDYMPSIMYFRIYRFIRSSTNVDDPYYEIKKTWNRKAQEFFDEYYFKLPDKKLYTFLKLSLAANIIDFGALENFNINDTVDNVIRKEPVLNDYKLFLDKIENSESILYLMDNAGEAYFDLLFIRKLTEEYPNIKKIGIGVREEPFVNDVTLNDFKEGKLATLIPSSSHELIGLPVCKNKFLEYEKNKIFQKIFNKYDIVISKGQGNYELFYKYKNIFFALIIKCKPISDILRVSIGDTVFYLSRE